MLDNLETLRVLSQTGTMTGAATQLRLTQSAISKRISSLEAETGKKLIEPSGRRVRITPAGLRLLERASPLLAELRAALKEEATTDEGRIVLAVSESVLASWGARALAQVKKDLPRLELELHSHRSLTVLDRVRSGDCSLGICAGSADTAPDLQAELLLEEAFAILPSRLDLASLPREGVIPVMTIEPHSATWVYLGKRLKRNSAHWKFQLEVTRTLQSFSCIVQLARCGFGHALVPIGVARAAGVPESKLVALPAPGLSRPVSVVGRTRVFAQPIVQTFLSALRSHLD